jgi:hypothetical protein
MIRGGKNMKKILSILFFVNLFLSGSVVGIAISKDIKQINHQTYQNIKVLDNDKFEIEAKYSYIRSYPGGGGIFIIVMTPKNDFSGFVSLEIKAAPNLNSHLDKNNLDRQSRITELTVQPDESIDIKIYEISIIATYHKKSRYANFKNFIDKIKFPLLSFLFYRSFGCNSANSHTERLIDIKTLTLKIEMFDWSSKNLPDAIIKRDELINWLETEHPEFGIFTGENCYAYVTYPGHLVVEHWTFLYENWEMRICYHVMIPPYNWSKLYLRKHGEVDAVFTAKCESDGTTYEIPITEYPKFYGY